MLNKKLKEDLENIVLGEIGPAAAALAGTALKSNAASQLARGVGRGIEKRMSRPPKKRSFSINYSSSPV
jgi:hypothetical protein